jgi:multicomponent Na+:H+ antiporter subunit E
VLAEGRSDAWGLALCGVAASAMVSLRLLPPAGPVSLWGVAGFAIFFIRQSISGGLQVAWMALRPRMTLAPTVLEMPLALPAGAPRVLMTAAVGLMPGTLGVHLDGDTLRLHVLDERLPAAAEAQALQARIAGIFAA